MESIKEWIEKDLSAVAKQLNSDISFDKLFDQNYKLSKSGKAEIYKILDQLMSALFPGCYCTIKHEEEDQQFFITEALRHTALDLHRFSSTILQKESGLTQKKADETATTITRGLIQELPTIRKVLGEDIKSAYKGDPAASSIDEIILSYPFVDAITTHRIAHYLYERNLPIIPRMMSERAHSRTGIDIHPGATIAPGFFIDHGTGVVIGETCTIGKNVKLYQGVTLGALSPFDKKGNPLRGAKRHPDIKDNVIIYANATILGGKTEIGEGSIIGGNCWITKSIPPRAVVYHKNEILIKDLD